jgi:allantoinase
MSSLDLLIHGGTLVTANQVTEADIAITGGEICGLGTGLAGKPRRTIDATGLHIFPGIIDSHVHFNDPGRAHWEGIASGSRALAAGGGTMFFDMPLNSHPPTLDAASFDLKHAAAQGTSFVDFALWGGLVPGNLDHLEELSQRGVVGFKAFMSNSGIEDFPCADERTLREGMRKAASLKRIVAVHAESETITRALTERNLAAGKTSVRDYLDSRPIEAELEAIKHALETAGETGCPLHIVHVSCGAGLALISSARKLGVNVTCETCPHYLILTEEDMVDLGAVAKCAPPLRPKPAQDALWEYLQSEEIFTIGSDHSPAPPDMKTDSNFFKVWGGISSVQHTLPLLITEGHLKRGLALPLLAKALSFNPAARFRLPAGKGVIDIGAEANLALVDLKAAPVVRSSDLLYRHPQSPYLGRALTGRVVQTILRGQTIFNEGAMVSPPIGKLVKPLPGSEV